MLTETLWMVNTRRCNFDCSFCYQGSHSWKAGGWQEQSGLQGMMNSRTAMHALDWASQWANRGLRVNWYGGEPLLNAKLMAEVMPQWQLRFNELGKELKWSITTNGSLLNAKNRDLLDKHDVGILLSLDGPPHIHNKQRVYYQGKPTWDDIPIDDILQWRPNIEIAWVLEPGNVPTPADFDWMMERGFTRINFNCNWLANWTAEDRIKLQEFSRWVIRRCIQSQRGQLTLRESPNGNRLFPLISDDVEDKNWAGKYKKISVSSNWMAKFNELHLKDAKPLTPCGTGLHMLALTPEGWLYPSQEMAFKAVEPGVAPGTTEHYRVGNIWNDPVIDQERLADVSAITNEQMQQPEGFDCNNCAANPISFGGCHCRYIGQDGKDPKHRYTVAPGWCQSTQAWVMGALAGARIEKYTTLKTGASSRPGVTKPQESGPHDMHVHNQPNYQPGPVQIELPDWEQDTIDFTRTSPIDVKDVYDELMKLKKMLKTEQLEKLQKQLDNLDHIVRPVARQINKQEQGQ